MERLVLALALTLVFTRDAHAQHAWPRNGLPQTVRLHLASWHDSGEYNNANLGVALRWDGGPVAGGFYNSNGQMSWYGGLVVPAFEIHPFQLELMAGVITGYSQSSPVDLVAVPTLGWHLSPRNTLQVVYMPGFVIPSNVVHVMFERRLGGSAPRFADRVHDPRR